MFLYNIVIRILIADFLIFIGVKLQPLIIEMP